jgi:hypothetical protein
MALITDADIIEIPELLAYENSLLETADKERVDIATKIRLAVDEVRARIGATLRGTSATGGYTLHHVVVTDALRWWLHCHALHLFFLECYGNQLNERYQRKEREYAQRAKTAQEACLEPGVPITQRPLPKPKGLKVEATSGALAAGYYYVAAAWQGMTGEQSALSAMTTFASEGAVTMRVSVEEAPTHSTGWNVYVGTTAENAARQNAVPIAPGQAWVMTGGWNHAGVPWSGGQEADVYLQPEQIFPRG